ncbi:unnamed protein product [Angiostrongylus costaricensis]|uniref:WH2 domain-containing protein n=1 Tax=Angiostrongylus costaricensis TaxID=334426 RepID=A0A0R3Q0D2_ANGCS|nr:unnamed protein product [Angiostrongylus costaricensis]
MTGQVEQAHGGHILVSLIFNLRKSFNDFGIDSNPYAPLKSTSQSTAESTPKSIVEFFHLFNQTQTSSPNRVTITPTGTSRTTTTTSRLTSKLPKRSDDAYVDPQIGCREILPSGSTTSGTPRKDYVESQYFLKPSENPKGHLVTASMKRPPMVEATSTLITSTNTTTIATLKPPPTQTVKFNMGPILGNLGNHPDLLECSTQETTKSRTNVFEYATEKETFKEQLGDIQLVKAKRGRNVQEILKRLPIRESKTSDEIVSDSVGVEVVDVLR